MTSMSSTTTMLVQFADAGVSVGLMLSVAFAGVLAGAVALLGLGFGMRKTIEHVTGGGTWGGAGLRKNVDWDELDRRARGSLEHDAR